MSKYPLQSQTRAFSLPTHRAVNILLLWAAVFLGHYFEDSLLIKLFTDRWLAGLPTLCLSAALTRSAGHITGPLGFLQENFPCEHTRENAAAQSVLTFPEST